MNNAIFVLCLLMCLKTINEVVADCVLNLKKDFGTPAPVFLKGNQYLMPNAIDGSVLFKKSEAILAACPGTKRFVVLNNDTTEFDAVKVSCQNDTTFTADAWSGQFRDIKCSGQPWFSAEPTGQGCYDGGKMYRTGYKINNKFYKLYEACFNPDLLRTSYVRHKLTPQNKYFQTGHRPNFIEGALFKKVKMSQVYKIENQKSRFNAILGDNKQADYLTKKQYLTRGHLAARADFPLRAAQIASFHYVNTAPQWMRGNAGDWAALEEALRRRVHAINATVDVITGTHGVTTLADSNGQDAEIYLHVDDNNNGVVPVPMYFYKLVYDPKRKASTAFVSINSSYHNATALEKLTFCNDVCAGNSDLSWMTWRQNDGTTSFCCSYEEFVKHVDYLPTLNVKQLFY